MNLFATGRFGTIGQFLSDDVKPISYRDFLRNGDLSGVRGKDVDVIHLGGVVGPALVAEDPKSAQVANVESLENFVVSLAEVARPSHLTYISTSHVYGKVRFGELLTEHAPLDPGTEYALQKLQAEGEISRICRSLGIPFTILRLFSILGNTGQPFTLAGRIQEAVSGRAVSIKCSDDRRDFLSPSGAAQAIEKVSRLRTPGIFNLCTGHALSVREAVTRILNDHQVPLDKVHFEGGESDKPWIVGSPEKLLEATGLEFKFSGGGSI